MDKRQQADEKYRKLFNELGITTFQYIGFEKKDRIWFRCKRCGNTTPRSNALFKGQQTKLVCRVCGNGTKVFSTFANEVLAFYQDGHSQQETIEKFGVGKYELQNWIKRRGVTNGRTIFEINKENSKRSAIKTVEKAGIRFKQEMLERGFDLVSDYQGTKTKVTLRCMKCGGLFERAVKHSTPQCPYCIEKEKEKALQERKNLWMAKKEQDEIIRQEKHRIKREADKVEHNKRLDELHICKVCGGSYSIRSCMKKLGYCYERTFGFCSKECRDKQKKVKAKESSRRRGPHSEHHYDRAVRLGLPAERGVTLKKLYERDQGICQICGMVCIYSGDGLSDLYPSIDHIIPMNNDPLKQGGHTWKNVQLAHRICNSNKRDYVGKEWHNDND